MSNVVQFPAHVTRQCAAREAQRIWLGYQKLLDEVRDTLADVEQTLRSFSSGP